MMKIFDAFLGFSALLLVVSNIIFNFFGFYFTGDTISYIYYSLYYSVGGPLEVFIKHTELWSPLSAILFGFLRELPISILSQERVYTFFILILLIIITYLLSGKITDNIIQRIVLVAMALFSSSQILIFRSAIPEALFVFLWLSSIYWFLNFINTEKQLPLFLFIIHAGLIPLSRYLGIGILFGFSLNALIFYLLHRKEKYSFYVFISLVLLIFTPYFSIYLKIKP